MAFGKGGTDDIRSSLPPQTLPSALERCHTSGKARNPPTHTSKTLQGKGGRQGAGMGGQIHVWGRQLPIPLRLCQNCRLRSPGPQGCPRRHRSFAALCSSAPAGSAVLPSRSRSSSLAWLPSPPGTTQSPAPSPRTQMHFPLRNLQTSNIFPPPLHVCHRTRMHES